MYRVIDTITIQGVRVHMLKGDPGYGGWGWELPDVFCADMRPETCVGYACAMDALEAVQERVGFMVAA